MIRTSRDTPLWQRIALPASVVLNLFLVALIGGHLLQNRGNEISPETPLARALARAEASLSSQDAASFGTVIRHDESKYAAAQQQIVEARRELQREITTEPFDQDKVRQALAAWGTAWGHFFDDFSNTLVEALSSVSPEGRRKLVAARRPPA